MGLFDFVTEIPRTKERSIRNEVVTFRNELDKFFWDEKSLICLLEGPAGSGKTFCYLSKIFRVVDRNPGTRVLLLRQHRVELSEAVLEPWENHVLPKNHPAKPKHGDASRAGRTVYKFPNGSEVHCGGVLQRTNLADEDDALGRLKSTQWDIIAVEEATEVEFDALQVAFSRLRADGIAWKQLILAFNPPSDPEHHIYRFVGKKNVTFYKTYHTDNPVYFYPCENGTHTNPVTGVKYSTTPKGEQYVNDILGLLEGSMSDRFFHGRAAKKPGLVHPEFNLQSHTVNQDRSLLQFVKDLPLSREEKTKYLRDNFYIDLSVDFGHAHPNTVQIFAKPINNDAPQFDNRFWKYRRIAEFYKTQVVSDEMGKLVLNWCGYGWDEEKSRHFYLNEEDMPEGSPGFVIPILSDGFEQISNVITDHQLESRVLFTRGSGLETTLANKTLESGIKLVSSILRDGKILFDLYEPMYGIDYMNNRHGKPCGLTQEFARYKFPRMLGGYGKRPIPLNDDGCTALRYYLADAEGLEDKPATYASAKKESNYGDVPVTVWKEDNPEREKTVEHIFGRSDRDFRELF